MWDKDEILREFDKYFETVTLDELYRDLKETDSLKFLEDGMSITTFENITANVARNIAVKLHYNQSSKIKRKIVQSKSVTYNTEFVGFKNVFENVLSVEEKLKLGA